MNYRLKNFNEQIMDLLQELKFAADETDQPLTESEKEFLADIRNELFEIYKKYNQFVLNQLEPDYVRI